MDWVRQIPIGQFVDVAPGWLRRLDPRLKMAWSLLFLLTPILAGSAWRLGLVGALIVLTACSGLPGRVWVRSLSVLLVVATLIGALAAFLPVGEVAPGVLQRPPNELSLVPPAALAPLPQGDPEPVLRAEPEPVEGPTPGRVVVASPAPEPPQPSRLRSQPETRPLSASVREPIPAPALTERHQPPLLLPPPPVDDGVAEPLQVPTLTSGGEMVSGLESHQMLLPPWALGPVSPPVMQPIPERDDEGLSGFDDRLRSLPPSVIHQALPIRVPSSPGAEAAAPSGSDGRQPPERQSQAGDWAVQEPVRAPTQAPLDAALTEPAAAEQAAADRSPQPQAPVDYGLHTATVSRSGLAWELVRWGPLMVGSVPLGPLVITRRSAELGLNGATLLVTVIQSTNLMLLTTPPEELVWALNWALAPLRIIGLPVDRLGFTLLLALRFLPLVQEELQNLLRSVATRAASARQLGRRGVLALVLAVAERLFRNVLLRAEQGAEALLARGALPLAPAQLQPPGPTAVLGNALAVITLALVLVLRWKVGGL